MTQQVVVFTPTGSPPCSVTRGLPHWAESAVAGTGALVRQMHSWQPQEARKAVVICHCHEGNLPDAVLAAERRGLLALYCCHHTAPPPELDDFLYAPFSPDEFSTRLRRLLNRHPAALRLDQLVGGSPAFLRAVDRIGPVARSAAPVLLRGETGVGKELFARAIHYNGLRRAEPFVPVNCGAIPEQLFENEIFGHARGAFTDAHTASKGLLAEADGGTLFLDEIDMLPPSAQAKLLRFLQDRQYRPLGSTRTHSADVRILSASNTSLPDLVARSRFREDLYHRLNVLPLAVPPLRERGDDIPLLAVHFANRFAAQYRRPAIRFTPEAMAKLLAYAWPGNVRELESVVHRAIVFHETGALPAAAIELAPEVGEAAETSKDAAMRTFERAYLIRLLAEHGGNVGRCASASGKDRRTIQRLLRKHLIERNSFTPAAE